MGQTSKVFKTLEVECFYRPRKWLTLFKIFPSKNQWQCFLEEREGINEVNLKINSIIQASSRIQHYPCAKSDYDSIASPLFFSFKGIIGNKGNQNITTGNSTAKWYKYKRPKLFCFNWQMRLVPKKAGERIVIRLK